MNQAKRDLETDAGRQRKELVLSMRAKASIAGFCYLLAMGLILYSNTPNGVHALRGIKPGQPGADQDRNLSVGFIVTHTDLSIEDPSENGYSKLAEFLTNYYNISQIIDQRIALTNLRQFDACILFPPQTKPDPEEVEAIHTYVEDGGGLLVASQGWANELLPYINSIVEEWGFAFMNNRLYEPENRQIEDAIEVGDFDVAPLGIVATNPIASMLTHPPIMRNSCTIQTTDHSEVTPVLTLSNFAFAEDYDHQDYKPRKDQGEPLANEAIVIANGQIGQGRVVAIGGHAFCNNKWINQSQPAQNAETILFSLHWLTQDLPPITK